MNPVRRTVVLAAGLAFALTLNACHEKKDDCTTNPSGPTCIKSSPPPPACTQSVVAQGSDSWGPSEIGFNDFSVPDGGRLDITVDWTNASSKIGVYVVPTNTCTLDQFNARSCNFLVRSEASTVKPRKVSTPNFAAGNYRWLILSDSVESISLQIVLSKGSCAALTGGQPTAYSGGDRLSATRMAIHF